MDFSNALEGLKYDKDRIYRKGWNGKEMWIFLCREYSTYDVPFNVDFDKTLNRKRLPFIIMKTADNCLVPWLASQTDILADDWEIINEKG